MAELFLKGTGNTRQKAMSGLEKSIIDTNKLLSKKKLPKLTDPKSVEVILRLTGGTKFKGDSYDLVISDINKKYKDSYKIKEVEFHNTYRISQEQLEASKISKSPTSSDFGNSGIDSRFDYLNL